jgi:2-dehydro-3-deoxyphosphogluconate aldolase/(4S)-4-hydroxy-2-oxoglutarate aldolase
MVVGGIDEKNVGAFLAAGAAGAGVGGNLANRQWIRDGAWDKITQAAQLLTGAVRQG